MAVTYRQREEFDALLAAAAPADAARLEGIATDVTDTKAASAVVEELIAEHSRLDILVNAVGGYAGGKNVWEDDPATYERMMALNLQSGFTLARAVLPVMIRAESRLDRERGLARRLRAFTRCRALLRVESRRAGLLRFTGRRSETLRHQRQFHRAQHFRYAGQSPGHAQRPIRSRWPKPEEIAQVVLFLCSAQARVIHGAAIPVYGRT